MRNVMRTGFVVGALAMVGAGCSCGESKPKCGEIKVAFTTPAAGSNVGPTFAVALQATAADGSSLVLSAASLKIDGQTVAGDVSGAKATFAGVTLTGAARDVEMTGSIVTDTCSSDATDPNNLTPPATQTVHFDPGTCDPKVTAFAFPQDADGNGALNSLEFAAGAAMKVTIAAGPSTCTTGVKVRIVNTEDGATVGPLTAFSDTGTANIDVGLQADHNPYKLFAELVRDGNTTALNTVATNPDAAKSIVVARAKPMCSNTTVLLNGPKTDQTAGNSTFDLLATGTAFSSNGATLTANFKLTQAGQADVILPMPAVSPATGTGELSVVFPLALTQTVDTYTLTLVATDSYGNSCDADPKTVTVDNQPLTVTITMPSGFSADGGAPIVQDTPYAMQATVKKGTANFECVTPTDGGIGGGCATASVKALADGGVMATGSADVVAGSTTLEVNFAENGRYELTASAVDALGNKGSATKVVEANLRVCGIAYVAPDSCPATIFRSSLNSNSDYGVTFRSGNCIGRPATLIVTGGATGSAAGTVATDGTFGPSPVHVTATGTFNLHAQVASQDAGMAADAGLDCVVNADLSTPVITAPIPPTNGTQATLAMAQDSNANQAGAQTTLTFNANIPAVPATAHADLCTTQAIDPVTTTQRVACPDHATGWYLLNASIVTRGATSAYSVPSFTFPEGTYSVKLVIVAGSSTNVSAPVSMVVDVTPPCVSAAGLTFDRDNGAGAPAFSADGKLNVAEYAQTATPFLSFAPGCGDTTTTLAVVNPVSVFQLTGAPLAQAALPTGVTASVTSAAGRFNANVTGLTGTSTYAFFVRLTDAVGNTNTYVATDTAHKSLTMALTAPACSITSPTLSLLGKTQVPAGTLSATVTTDVAAVGTTVSTDLVGPAPATTVRNVSGTATAGVASPSFAGLTGENSWTLNAKCTDTSGNQVTAVGKTLTIDLVDPVIAFVTPVNNGKYTSAIVPTSLSVTGANNQVVTVKSGTTTITTPTVVAATGLATDATATYPISSAAQTLSATVQDAAGNTGTATPVSITVNNVTCSLVQTNVFLGGGKAYINHTLAPSGAANFTGTSNCFNAPVTLSKLNAGGTPISPPVASGTSNATGVIGFIGQTVVDGEVYRVTIDNGAGLTTSADYTIDTGVPVLTFVTPNATPGTYAVLAIPTTVNVTGAEGQQVSVTSNGSPITTMTVTGGVATDLNTTYPKNVQTVMASVTDVGGNTGTASISIVVNSTACSLSPTNVVQANGNSYINAAAAPGNVAAFTATSDCFNAPTNLVLLDSGGNPVGAGVNGTSSATGAISFPGVTVADGQAYRLTVRNPANLATTHDYTIDTSAPVVAFVSPANNGKYTALAVPTTINVTGANGQAVTVTSTVTAGAPQTIANMTVTAGVATDSATTYPVGVQSVTATVADLAGNPGTATVSITVNNVGCTLTQTNVQFAGSTAYINRTLAPGGVTNITATTSCNNAVATLYLLDSGGNPIGAGTAGTSSAAGVIAFNGQTVTDGQVYRVTVQNSAGLATSKDYTVDTVVPAVTFTSPTSTDGGPAVVVVTPAGASVTTGAPNGSPACAFYTPTAGVKTAAGCGMVASGAVTLPVAYPGEGVYTVQVEITEPSGNVGTGSVTVLVQLTGCGMAFTRPGTCPALISNAQVNTGFYTFQTQSKTTCIGVPVALTVQSKLADGGVGASSAVASGNIPAGGVTSIPAAVTTGGFLYTATVNNIGVGAGTASAQCDVTVDLLGPSIQSPVVPTGQPYAIINAAQDTQTAVAGAQRLLQYSALVPPGGRVDVCTTQATDPESGAPRTGTPECGTGYYLLKGNSTASDSAFTFPEGAYDIKIVVVAADNTTISSAPVSILTDVTRPCVRAASRRLPQDSNTDGRLNSTELGAAVPQLEFDLDPACKDTSLATLAANPVVIREIVGAAAPSGSFALPADVTFASNKFTVNLTQGIVNEKDYTFWILLTDLAGNTNLVQASNDPSTFPVRIDKVAPSCDIVSPGAATTLLGQSQVPSGAFGVTVATSSDVVLNGVSLGLTGGATPQTGSATPAGAGNQASTSFTVSGTHAYALTATCTDASGNQTSATTRNLTIDLDPPTCAITSPTNVSAYAVNSITTSLTAVGADGRSVSCTSNGTTLGSSFLVNAGSASTTFTYPNGTQTVTCNLTDAASNAGSCSVANVVVNSTSCGLNVTNAVSNANGSWFNSSNTTGVIAGVGSANIVANTPDCGSGKSVTLVRTSPAGVPTTVTSVAGGNAPFNGIALADGETWSVTIDNGAGITTTKTFRVALVAPTAPGGVTVNSTAVASGTNLYFVAPLRNRNVETAVAGYFADLTAGTAGAQFDLAVTGVTGARKFSLDGTLQVLFNGATVVSQAITTDPQTFSLPGTTLPQNVSSTLTLRLLDAAGNQTDLLANPTQVDVIAPGEPTVTQNVTNARTAQVTLQWNPTYDDGADNTSGGHTGYDLRWTTSSVPGNGSLATTTLYFAATTAQESVSVWSGSQITRILTLPPLNTYFISVRAKDEVGNYSDFTAPVGLPNFWTPVTLANPGVSTDFGSTIAANANVTGSSLPDIVVASSTRGSNAGSVYVYAGANPFNSQTGCAAGCQELTAPDATGLLFGSDLSTDGNVGDDAADATTTGMSDVLVGQRSYSTTGRAFIFFGSTGSLTKSIEIRGDASNTQIGWTTRIVKDLDGDGLDEVALNAYLYGGGRGRVYIFKGRSYANWQAAFVSGQTYVAVASADWVVEGEFPLTAATPANTSNGFGMNRHGLITLPGVTGGLRADGGVIPELVIPTSRANLSKTTLFAAASVVASSAASPLLALSGGIQTLSQTPSTTSNSFTVGFGAVAWGRRPVVGSGKADLFVSYPNQNTVYYYSTWSASGAVGGTSSGSISGSSLFGSNISAGDLNGDGLQDIVVSEGSSTGNGAWVLYQKSSMGPFDSPVGGTNIRFQVSEFRPVVGATSKFGTSSATTDIDGINGNDIVFSDETAGMVKVWR